MASTSLLMIDYHKGTQKGNHNVAYRMTPISGTSNDLKECHLSCLKPF